MASSTFIFDDKAPARQSSDIPLAERPKLPAQSLFDEWAILG
jgi:hypothetical protein